MEGKVTQPTNEQLEAWANENIRLVEFNARARAAPDLARLVLEKDVEIARKDAQIWDFKEALKDLLDTCNVNVRTTGTTYAPFMSSRFDQAIKRLIKAIDNDRQAMKEKTNDDN